MLGLKSFKKLVKFGKGKVWNRVKPMSIIAVACIRRRELRVSVEGKKEKFRSLFVGMSDKNNKTLYIDALGRDLRHEFLVPNKSKITIFFEMSGIQYSFTTTFLGLEVFAGFNSLRIKVPKRMNEGQRRQAFRIEPSLDEPARINLKDGASVNALNISGNGACFRSKSPLEPGEVIPVDVWLPDREDKLKAEFEVIAIEKDSRRQRAKKVTVGEYKVRGRFKGLADISRQLIHYYVANRQRELVGILN